MHIFILYLLFYLLEGLIFSMYCISTFVSPASKTKQILYILAFYSVLSFVAILEQPLLNVVSFLCINYLILRYLYKIKWYTSLFHAGISTAVMGLSEIIPIGLAPYFINDYSASNLSFNTFLILGLMSKFIYFLLMFFLSRFPRKQWNGLDKINISLFFLITIPIISLFLMLSLLTISGFYNSLHPSNTLLSFSAIGLITINILIWVIYLYNRKKSSEFTAMQIELQKEADMVEYYKMLDLQRKNQNMLIHDIKKHLQSIALLSKSKDYEKLNTYIESIISSGNLKTSVRICDNELLNAIIYRYTRRCKELEIDFRVDIRSNTLGFLKDDEITSLFCNLVDNAIESTSNISGAFIELSVYILEETNWTIIAMTNTCLQKPPIGINGDLHSSKKDGKVHGYGTKNISRIVNEYNGEVQYYYDDYTHIFHTIIMIKPHP